MVDYLVVIPWLHEEPELVLAKGENRRAVYDYYDHNLAATPIVIPLKRGIDLGTPNDMEFKCKNCSNPIPAEDEDPRALEDAVRIQQGGAEHPCHYSVWWFCDMKCFSEYVVKQLVKGINNQR
ncbi:hypothetical protein AKJ58_00515 [candidate division MSBL1 archaeon SCGC-AAA385D11]|uniref:Uncharacterized protein n=1 Tax=candidate division MSBL1 archaeon SCGC-AAA385D11 TaxID=1698286 RepID=A0A133VP82_9EURY|nr:hypothetical protein AKJ58_00515 [candidate division MSBL1 archaeon SCGC-AAA385D11]